LSNNNNNNISSYIARKKEKKITIGNRVYEDSYEKLKDILRKERKDIQDWLQDSIDDFIKKHGDGNPVFTLDHFNDENFLATPAYHRPLHVWKSYLTKCSDNEYKEWTSQLESLLNLERRITNQR